MRSATVSGARLRLAAFALLASLTTLPCARAQDPFEPYPWQWSSIERKVELTQTTAVAILQNWTATIDPRAVSPEQYALSLELHSMVAMLELDLRYLRAELAGNVGSEWFAHASEVVQRRIEVHGKRLEEAWNQGRAWHNALVPNPVVGQQIPVLLAHLSRVEGELGLCDYWKEGRNDGAIRGVFAEIDSRTPYRVEGNLRVYKIGQPLFLRTGFVLHDGRRVDTARRMRLEGVAGEREDDGFRLGVLGPGTYRATVVRRDQQAATVEFAVREDALRLNLVGDGPGNSMRGRILLQVLLDNGRPFTQGNVDFSVEQAGFRDQWRPIAARVAPVDRGETYEVLDLRSGSYRVQARAQGFSASEFVRFDVREPKLVIEFAERGSGGRGGFGGRGSSRSWTRFRVLADGEVVEEGLRFESETLERGGRWQQANLEPRTGRFQGFFVIEDAASGRHRLRASGRGYEPSEWTEFEVERPALELAVAQANDGTALFTVTEEGRRFQPAYRFEVQQQAGRLQWQPLNVAAEAQRTRGQYRVTGLRDGRHRARVSADGFETSPWVEFDVAATPEPLYVGIPKKIFEYQETIPISVGSRGRRRLDCSGVVISVEMSSRGVGFQPCPFVRVASTRECTYELSGFRPGFEYRLQAVDRSGRHTPSAWGMIAFQNVPQPPQKVAVPIVPRNARRSSTNVHFKQGNWDKTMGEIQLGPGDAARVAHGFELTAENNEFLCVNYIVVEGRNERNQARTYTFFEPLMYDVSRLANRGYASFEYVTPRGRNQGDGVYVSPNPEVPPPVDGMVWPPYSRWFQVEHAKVRNPKFAYSGDNKNGRSIDGQNGIIKEREGGREVKGTIRFLLPEPMRVQTIRVRHQAQDGTEASVKMIVEQ
ncbi:MAG: hypothetical protein H6833_11765 [Planctomycetes bacterium]|nr:hypothetical protein [Planctomycetota bacterium]